MWEECWTRRRNGSRFTFFVLCVFGISFKIHCVHFHLRMGCEEEKSRVATFERCFASSIRLHRHQAVSLFYRLANLLDEGKSQILDSTTWAKINRKINVWLLSSTIISLTSEHRHQLRVNTGRIYRARASAHTANSLRIG